MAGSESSGRSGRTGQVGAVDGLVSTEFGDRLLGLQLEERHGCFGVEFSSGYGEEPSVTFGDSGCIGARPWHVVVGTGGQAGTVDWTVVMAATRPEVDRVVVATPSQAHDVEVESPSGWPWRIFRLGLNERVTAIAAYNDDGSLLSRVELPDLTQRRCDWICAGEGTWAVQFDLDQPLDPADFERAPDVSTLSRDPHVRDLLEGKRFMLYQNNDWGGCAGVERGGSWTFMLDTGHEIDRELWRTVDPAGRAKLVRATKPAEQVVVDIDRDRNEAISLLPYDLNTSLLVNAKPTEAPLATDEPHEAPLEADHCRRLG